MANKLIHLHGKSHLTTEGKIGLGEIAVTNANEANACELVITKGDGKSLVYIPSWAKIQTTIEGLDAEVKDETGNVTVAISEVDGKLTSVTVDSSKMAQYADNAATTAVSTAIEALDATIHNGTIKDGEIEQPSDDIFIKITQVNGKLDKLEVDSSKLKENLNVEGNISESIKEHAEKKYTYTTEDGDVDGLIHLEAGEREAWNAAKDAINLFLDNNAAVEGAVDTLKEIQGYLNGEGSVVGGVLSDISNIKEAIGIDESNKLISVDTKIADAKKEIIGGDTDTDKSLTIRGVKKYAESYTESYMSDFVIDCGEYE